MAEDGDNWIPPTEAETKILQAKRERSDKISKLLADYLLRGYKMINSVCDCCETVLLQDRHQKTYCVACSEIDNEHAKDDPALSGAAAQRQIAESQYARSETLSALTGLHLPANDISHSTLHRNSNTEELSQLPTTQSTLTGCDVAGEEGMTSCIEAVQEKMLWASKKLTKTNSPEASLQWCNLLKACAETLVALRHAQSIETPVNNSNP